MTHSKGELFQVAQKWNTSPLTLPEAKLLLLVKLHLRAVGDHWHRLEGTPVGDEVEALCFKHLPATLNSYLSLPREARNEVLEGEDTPANLFTSALEAYVSALERVRRAALADPARQLLVESIFARAKYGEAPESLSLKDTTIDSSRRMM